MKAFRAEELQGAQVAVYAVCCFRACEVWGFSGFGISALKTSGLSS